MVRQDIHPPGFDVAFVDRLDCHGVPRLPWGAQRNVINVGQPRLPAVSTGREYSDP